jgi:lysophospholipase L1-like esterase
MDESVERPGKVHNLAQGFLCLPSIVEYLPTDLERFGSKCRGRTIDIFMVGAADSVICGQDPYVPLDEFQQNLKAVTTICEDKRARPLFVGIPPIDTETPMRRGTSVDADTVSQYDEAVAVHARDSGAPYIDVRGHLAENGIPDEQFLHDDGQHPGPFGHMILHRLVSAQLDDMISSRYLHN